MTDPSVFARWLRDHLGLVDAELGPRLGGGHSNVTQLVRHRDGLAVLRRPPDNAISSSAAAGVRREHTMLTALHGHASVPRPLGFCDDPAIVGQPFALIEHVDGVSITTSLPSMYPQDAATLTTIGEALVDAIAVVHRLDWRALGIEAPRAPEDYVAKQIARGRRVRAEDAVRALPLVEDVGAWLSTHRPPPPPPTVMHGDYHLDNTLFATTTPRLAAIIDWELATIGDPHADLALFLAFWGARPTDRPGFAFVQQVSRSDDRVATRDALATRWSRATGLPLDDFTYYRVFALWRLATIVEGAYVLFRKGLVHDDYARALEHDVPALLDEAALLAGLRGTAI